MAKVIPSTQDFNRESDDAFIIDTRENAIDSLETAASFVVRKDKLKWKWITIALHHALYSFCVAALEQGNREHYTLVSKDRKGRRADEGWFLQNGQGRFRSRTILHGDGPGYIIKWEATEEEPPIVLQQRDFGENGSQQELIGFWTALARVQDGIGAMGRLTITQPLQLTEEEWSAIKWLVLAARNDFMHFVPSSIMYGVQGFKKNCLTVLRPIEFVALECNAILYDDREVTTQRIRKALTELKTACS